MSDFQLGPGPLTPEFEQVKSDIGIVENGNTATHAIPAGYYVIWKGDLYVAKTDISSGTALGTSNLTTKTQGIGADVGALNSKLGKFSLGTYSQVASYDALKTLLTNAVSTMSNFEVRNIMFSCTSAFETFGTALWTAVLTKNTNNYFSALCYPVNTTGMIKVVRNQGGAWYIEDYALNARIAKQQYTKEYNTAGTTLAQIQADADAVAGSNVGVFNVGYTNTTASASLGLTGAYHVVLIKHNTYRAVLQFIHLDTGFTYHCYKVDNWSSVLSPSSSASRTYVNGAWKDSPANQTSFYKYEAADTTTLDLPYANVMVMVSIGNTGRGVAVAYSWPSDISKKVSVWINRLHNSWQGWQLVVGTETITPTVVSKDSRLATPTILTAKRNGNVVMLSLAVMGDFSSTSWGVGENVEIKVSGLPLPSNAVTSASYMGTTSVLSQLMTDGTLRFRNANASAIASSQYQIVISYTYVLT